MSTEAACPAETVSRSVGRGIVGLASIIGSLVALAACAWVLFRRVDWIEVRDIWLRLDLRWVALAVIVYWMQYPLLAIRLQRVVEWTSASPGKLIALPVIFRITCASGFVSAVAPIGLFGDAARFAGLRFLGSLPITTAIRMTLYDRLIGLKWLCVVGLVTLPSQYLEEIDRRIIGLEAIAFLGICTAILAAIPLSRILARVSFTPLARFGRLMTGYSATLTLRRSLAQLGLASVSLVFAASSLLILAQTAGIALAPPVVFMFLPILLLINSVPFLYMGWGGRELAFVATIGAAARLTNAEALSLSSIWGVVIVFSAASNGLCLIGRWRHARV